LIVMFIFLHASCTKESVAPSSAVQVIVEDVSGTFLYLIPLK